MERLQSCLTPGGTGRCLATVIATSGSTFRGPGARMVISANDEVWGALSGGCVEADLAEVARVVRADGRSRLVSYDGAGDGELIWGLGLGCDGSVETLVEPVPDGPGTWWFEPVLAELAAGRPCAAAIRLDGENPGSRRMIIFADGTAGGTLGSPLLDLAVKGDVRRLLSLPHRRAGTQRYLRSSSGGFTARVSPPGELVSDGDARIYVECFAPSPRLFLFGAGPDGAAVASLARGVGFAVTLVDWRPRNLSRQRFPACRLTLVPQDSPLSGLQIRSDDFCLIMTHAYLIDRTILAGLAPRAPKYIGILGPYRRTERLLREIEAEHGPLPSFLPQRLSGPVGLDTGGEELEELALSIVAELQAVRYGRSAERLNGHRFAMHTRGLESVEDLIERE